MILKLTFSSPIYENKFLLETGEKDISQVNISLLNYALQAEGLVDISTEGDPIEFLVLNNGNWNIELCSDPISRIRNGEILEPSQSKIKLLGSESWSLNDGTWGQIRICNRYRPLNGTFNETPKLAPMGDIRYTEVIVMDSGINKQHIEFENAVIEDLYKIPIIDTYNDNLHHGTAVASLIVGKTLGIHPNCTIKNVKVFDNGFKPGILQLAEAFDAILNYHLTCPTVPKVLNLSWIMPKSLYIEYKLETLFNAGILIVSAAGNSPINIDLATPAGYVNSLTVAGSTKNDIELVALYGINKKISVYAPGEGIKVAYHDSVDEYTNYDGSSFSCAFASAVAAQHFSIGSQSLTNQQVFIDIINDSTSFPLTLNDNVSGIENKLLHNVLAGTINLTNNQFLGTFLDSFLKANELKFPISRFMDIPPRQQSSYNIIWDQTTAYNFLIDSFIDTNDIVNLKLNQNIVIEPNTTKVISFKIEFTGTAIHLFSPNFYIFLTSRTIVDDEEMNNLLTTIEPYDDANPIRLAKFDYVFSYGMSTK